MKNNPAGIAIGIILLIFIVIIIIIACLTVSFSDKTKTGTILEVLYLDQGVASDDVLVRFSDNTSLRIDNSYAYYTSLGSYSGIENVYSTLKALEGKYVTIKYKQDGFGGKYFVSVNKTINALQNFK